MNELGLIELREHEPFARQDMPDKNSIEPLLETKEDGTLSASYYVGVGWIVENETAICVQPKQFEDKQETDCMKMLFEALEEVENFEHLDGLYDIYFNKPQIEVNQRQDLLSPFLIVQFLRILKRIVQKGLKKSYYPVVRNLEAKIKGKLLINQTIKVNAAKNRIAKNMCQYNEFGINGKENKILKKALMFARHAIENYNIAKITEKDNLMESYINYIYPAFEQVSDDIQIDRIRIFKPNPMYREYSLALKLAQLILKRYSYCISKAEKQATVPIPPFWIDMSKLFELYVFKKLRDVFQKQGEVIYHKRANLKDTDENQELDFLITDKDNLMVADAKYKKYGEDDIKIADVRQICGYARLKKVYDILKLKIDENIDCLIIYPNQKCDKFEFDKGQLKKEPIDDIVKLHKAGISLPKTGQQAKERIYGSN
jgi:5-methylcytosine-specific restriction enzyme subunit McrC